VSKRLDAIRGAVGSASASPRTNPATAGSPNDGCDSVSVPAAIAGKFAGGLAVDDFGACAIAAPATASAASNAVVIRTRQLSRPPGNPATRVDVILTFALRGEVHFHIAPGILLKAGG
jgi:hypothetical protein